MTVRSRLRRSRASTIPMALMLGLLAGCAQDNTTGPDQRPQPPEGSGKLENLEPDLDAVRASSAFHYADGYVWADNPTSPSYKLASSGYDYNRAGGTIRITRQATGSYTVRFNGLSSLLGTKSTVHVTGYSGDNAYCKPVNEKLSNDVVHVRCFSAASGSPADAYYTVFVMKSYTDLAFAFANLPTSTNYAPSGSASYNAGGAIRVFRNGVGNYTVKFTGLGARLTSNGGHAQANAIGSGAQHCIVDGWFGSPDLTVTVVCFSRTGAAKDVKFNLFFTTPLSQLAYAWADNPTTPSYSPNAFYRTPNGAVNVTRLEKGRYTVTWSGLTLLDGGDVQVTAYGGTNIECKVESWGENSAAVRCFNPGTNALVDSYFDVMMFS